MRRIWFAGPEASVRLQAGKSKTYTFLFSIRAGPGLVE